MKTKRELMMINTFFLLKSRHPFEVHIGASISKRSATPMLIFTGIMRKEFYIEKILPNVLLPVTQRAFSDDVQLPSVCRKGNALSLYYNDTHSCSCYSQLLLAGKPACNKLNESCHATVEF